MTNTDIARQLYELGLIREQEHSSAAGRRSGRAHRGSLASSMARRLGRHTSTS